MTTEEKETEVPWKNPAPTFEAPRIPVQRESVHGDYESAIPITRRGGTRQTVEDACRKERVIKLLVCDTAACRDHTERAMGVVRDQRLATAQERITEVIAEQIADSDSRTYTSVSSGAGNLLQAGEESSGIPSSEIPCAPSDKNRNHWYCLSSSSSACATPSDSGARPNFDAVLNDRDEMIDYFCLDLTKEQTAEANWTYDLLLTLGADTSVARSTVAELLSPQILGTMSVHLAPGDCWIFHRGSKNQSARKGDQ